MKTAATRTRSKKLGAGREKKELVPPGRGDFAFGDARGVQVVADGKVRSTLSSVSLLLLTNASVWGVAASGESAKMRAT